MMHQKRTCVLLFKFNENNFISLPPIAIQINYSQSDSYIFSRNFCDLLEISSYFYPVYYMNLFENKNEQFHLLSHIANQFMKGIFPCVHLYNSHCTNHFVHDPNPLVRKHGTFHPKTNSHFSHTTP